MPAPQPHPVTPGGATTPISEAIKRGPKRGNYNCGRCGQPKKGHVCNIPKAAGSASSTPTPVVATPSNDSASSVVHPSPLSIFRPTLPPSYRQPGSNLRRALSFDDIDVNGGSFDEDDDEELEDESDLDDSGKLPMSCLWEVLRRLPPPSLLAAARVCKGWRETTRRLWRAAEELRLRVPAKSQVGFVGSVLQKCPGLVSLSLRMESDVDATVLACIAFSCPNLERLEISTSGASVNRITGDELGRFVADKRCLTSLKMEGCSNFGGLFLCSTTLSTLWLSDLHSLSKTVFSCPNLTEISLNFSRQENDSTDLTTLVDGLGRNCPRIQNLHIASVRLSHSVVLSLADANLRGLRMLSLVLGSEISDASVAAIASSYSNLELLDLSGSSISDSGIGMICNIFPDTLSRLLLALCPNITSSGIQFAAAQLPLLELMDCGMSLCHPNSETSDITENGSKFQKTSNRMAHIIYQKLIIKHSRLKKLSLWGCSGLDVRITALFICNRSLHSSSVTFMNFALQALYLNCPDLNDLNLNSCCNLHPERLLLQCPSLETVHATGCHCVLIDSIQNQMTSYDGALENPFLNKRLPDGSKRVQAPHLSPKPSGIENHWKRASKRHCSMSLKL
ncbi:OLC1v1007146C2 [Oldenlandia corymbosa var. corymbosa]|uniref:OLC1v1007146C2 n=1 Tax=Oldenlandia corymbosa var. corymbosa TaxID=529605 RepID=A0AAV1DLD1_OLDCO|nr:OLC1v1007146C2 [Oldenlandia corymbosa var. corymbosa]